MNPYVMLPLLTAVALIQSTILSRIGALGAPPNLMLLVVLVWTVLRGVDEGLLWAFLGGLMLDLLSGGPLAHIALGLLAATFVAGRSVAEQVGSQAVRLVILTLLGAMAYHLVLLIILNWSGHEIDWAFALVQVAGPSVLVNAALAPLVLPPLRWLEQATAEEGMVL